MTPVRLVQLMDANDTDAPMATRRTRRPSTGRTTGGGIGLPGRDDFFSFFMTDDGLDEVKTYADGIGLWKVYIVPMTGARRRLRAKKI